MPSTVASALSARDVLHYVWGSVEFDAVDDEKAGNMPFVIIRQDVPATMDMGVGHAGLVKLCGSTSPTEVLREGGHCCQHDDAANTVRQMYRERDPPITDDIILDLTVTFDGSWMKRGHNSLYGIGCVVDVETGLVLDLALLSLYCQRCAIAKSQCRGNRAKFNRWLDSHTECNQNYRSTSGGMAVEAAEILWKGGSGTPQ